jgi:cation diffusion facilitator CzcD-associated flavoprotein CzcO
MSDQGPKPDGTAPAGEPGRSGPPRGVDGFGAPERPAISGRPAGPEADAERRHTRVAIVGAGFGGLGTAIRLQQSGENDFVIFERADEVGGTWRDNSYPGCACDIPSFLYSFSFAPDTDWSRAYAPQSEIYDYLRRVTDRFGLRPRIRFNHDVASCAWNDAEQLWEIDTSAGRWTAAVLVVAPGPLAEPRVPSLPGLADFTGTVFHSARWRHDHDLTGRRVAVVGTGASAIQIVPEIVGDVAHLTLLQRTPAWVMPRRNRRYRRLERALAERTPALGRGRREMMFWSRELLLVALRSPRRSGPLAWIGRRKLARQVPDPALRKRLTPDYSVGCKRVLASSAYYPAVSRDNVTVTGAASAVRPGGIVDADGIEHEVDTIVFTTGFRVTDGPVGALVRGRDGRTLDDVWAGSPEAYLGVGVHGFPNLFLLLGPNTGLGHNSVVVMIEAQVEQVLGALRHLDASGGAALEPTAAAQTAYVNEVDDAMRNTVWTAGGCRSWYLDVTGRNSALWPGFAASYRRRLRRFEPAAWAVTPARTTGQSAPARPLTEAALAGAADSGANDSGASGAPREASAQV